MNSSTNFGSGLLAEGVYHITFDWPVFLSQLFGFAVIVFAFVKWIVPPVKRMTNRAQDTVQRQLDESSQAADRLTEAKHAYDNAIADAQSELDRLRADAQADSERIIAQMREAAAAEVERVRKQGRDQIMLFHRQLIRDLRTDMAATMLDRTEERVRHQLDNDRSRADSIDRFIEEIEAMANASPAIRRQVEARWN